MLGFKTKQYIKKALVVVQMPVYPNLNSVLIPKTERNRTSFSFRSLFGHNNKNVNQCLDDQKWNIMHLEGHAVAETHDDKTYVICLSNKKDILLLDCNHIPLCVECTRLLQKLECPLCRKPISQMPRRVFF